MPYIPFRSIFDYVTRHTKGTSRPHLPPLVTRPSLLIGCPQSSSQEQATADQREDDPNPRTIFMGTLLSPDDAESSRGTNAGRSKQRGCSNPRDPHPKLLQASALQWPDLDRPLPAGIPGIGFRFEADPLPFPETIEAIARHGRAVKEQVSPRLSVWRNEAEAPVIAHGLDHSGCHDSHPF